MIMVDIDLLKTLAVNVAITYFACGFLAGILFMLLLLKRKGIRFKKAKFFDIARLLGKVWRK